MSRYHIPDLNGWFPVLNSQGALIGFFDEEPDNARHFMRPDYQFYLDKPMDFREPIDLKTGADACTEVLEIVTLHKGSIQSQRERDGHGYYRAETWAVTPENEKLLMRVPRNRFRTTAEVFGIPRSRLGMIEESRRGWFHRTFSEW